MNQLHTTISTNSGQGEDSQWAALRQQDTERRWAGKEVGSQVDWREALTQSTEVEMMNE